MKRVNQTILIVALVMTVLLSSLTLSAQCSNCTTDYVSSGNHDPDFAPDWSTANSANNTVVGRDYLLFDVVEGIVYRWTTVGAEDTAAAIPPSLESPGLDFNTELTLRRNCNEDKDPVDGHDRNLFEYNDNGLYRNQSLVEWKATYTGTVYLLVTAKTCTESTATTSVFWQRIGSSECENNYRNNPTGTFTTPAGTPAWTNVGGANAIIGGDYQQFHIQKGQKYQWTTEGDTSFDSQLTLFKENSDSTLTFLAYNDDVAATTQSTLTYTAPFTGNVQLLTSKYRCKTCQADAFGSYGHCSFTTLRWQRGDCTNCIDDKNTPGSPLTPDTSEDNKSSLNSGDYYYFNVVAGKVYRWRLSNSDYMLTLRNGGVDCSGDFITDGDKIIWKATFTGVAEVLISKKDACTSGASGSMRLYYVILDDPSIRFETNPSDGSSGNFIGVTLDNSTNTFFKILPSENWSDAIDACDDLVVVSDDDSDIKIASWRLVTINEISSIVDYEKISPASFFPGIGSSTYWSSTTIHHSTNFAWSIIMDDGRTYRAPKTESSSVLCAAGATISGEVQKDYPMETRHLIGWVCDKSDPNDKLDVRLSFYDKNGSIIKYKPHVMDRDLEIEIKADMHASDFPGDVPVSEIPSQAYIDSQCGGSAGKAHMFFFDLSKDFDAKQLAGLTDDKAPFTVKVEGKIGAGWRPSYFEVLYSPQQFVLTDICGDGFTSGDPSQANPENCDDGNAITEDCDYGWFSCTVCDNTCHNIAGAIHLCGDSNTDIPDENCDDGNTNREHCTVHAGTCGGGGGICSICNELCSTENIPAPCCGDGLWDGPGGDGLTSGPESCDDGNGSNNDNCLTSCKINVCGDGYTNPSLETCDNGTAVNGEYNNDCNVTCTGLGPYCGDGAKDITDINGALATPEVCDNGAANGTWTITQDATSCATDCMGVAPYCGDSTKDVGYEECDAGSCGTPPCNNGAYSGCNANCTRAPYCGDGIKQTADGEICDEGSHNGEYGHCNTACNGVVKCGDGVIQPTHEECDWLIFGAPVEWNLAVHSGCTNGCDWAHYCGDNIHDGPDSLDGGILTGAELCDEGSANVANGDLPGNVTYQTDCKESDCTFVHYCGDGILDNTATNGVNGSEQCDEAGHNSETGWCLPNCKINVCNDGFRCSEVECGSLAGTIVEQCDDGNALNNDSCVTGCLPATCQDSYRKLADSSDPWVGWVWNGDSSQAPNEQCDDGNAVDSDSCTLLCKAPTCGDNITKTANSTWNGDGTQIALEECDMGMDNSNNAACLANCDKNVGHDGYRCNGIACGLKPWSTIEACDDGNINNDDGCVDTCRGTSAPACAKMCLLASCGDNYKKTTDSATWNGDDAQLPNEGCEDGNNYTDNCTSPPPPWIQVCTNACVMGNCNNTCGDGTLDAGEQCDMGAANANNAACLPNCQRNTCGDNIVCNGAGCGSASYPWSTNENCDDGTLNGNYSKCKANCSGIGPHCGDNIINGPENCDDAVNDGSYARCKPGCQSGLGPHCGDALKNGPENCDDGGNNGNYNYCRSNCTGIGPYCGDGVPNGPESCDQGTLNGTYNHCKMDCTANGSYCGDSISGDLKLYYTSPALAILLDEGDGNIAHDTSGHGLHGDIYGASWMRGRKLQSLDFDGTNDYINLGDPAGLNITGNQTISMWIKPDNFSHRQNPYAKAYGGEGTITLETDGRLNYYHGTSGANAGPFQGFNSSQAIVAGVWSHIAVVRDFTNHRLRWYINGQQTNQAVTSFTHATASALPATIGRGYAGYFGGSIDELRVYPYAMVGENCDDGTAHNGQYTPGGPGYCSSDCLVPHGAGYCGDDIRQSANEVCDDGTAANGTYNHCKANCSGMGPRCGDSVIQGTHNTYYANETNITVPDNNTVYSNISVPATGTVQNVRYQTSIIHTYQGDLTVDIIAPDGTTLNLWNRGGGSASNLYFYAYTSAFNTKSLFGTWKLRVQDSAGGDTGYIDYFRLTINYNDGTGPETCDQGALNGRYKVAAPGYCSGNCIGYGSGGYCHDGTRQSAYEQCDDGNTTNTDSCVGTCKTARCGDGYVWSGHEACEGSGTWSGACCGDDWKGNCEKWYRYKCVSCQSSYTGCN